MLSCCQSLELNIKKILSTKLFTHHCNNFYFQTTCAYIKKNDNYSIWDIGTKPRDLL